MITSITAYVIAVVFLVVVPVIYFITEFNNKLSSLIFMAQSMAGRISEIIYTSPDSWQFREHNLQFVLNSADYFNSKLHYLVVDQSGSEVLRSNEEEKFTWLHSVSSELSDGANQVGTLTLSFDLMPLLGETLVVAGVAFVMSVTIYIVLRLLPFAHLERAMRELAESRELLSKEVDAKVLALAEQKRISNKMEFQSLHDPLTRLPNRKLFNQTINELIHPKDTNDVERFCVILLDLNRFKEINDALGHHMGDQVLEEFARRLYLALPDAELVARLGGDEYAVLMKNDDFHSQVTLIEDSLKKHFNLEGFHLTIGVSIGIACFPEHGSEQEVLVRNADIAMYHAKNSGEIWAVYNEEFNTTTPDKLQLASDLRHALENDLLTLNYQPKMCLNTDAIVSVEALARWNHPQYGMIPPDVFIPMAEQSNLINLLTSWVLKTAMNEVLPLEAASHSCLSVAINISARNLHDARLAEQAAALIEEFGVDPARVTLEITETSMMSDPEQSKLMMHKLTQLGLKLSIDDFGTGYSSLSYLKRLPVSQIKIDRSFVMNMLTDLDDQIIVKSTIDLAHSLSLEVVAEGIEDEAVLRLLKSYGCELAQGYFIAKPMELKSLKNYLEKFNSVVS